MKMLVLTDMVDFGLVYKIHSVFFFHSKDLQCTLILNSIQKIVLLTNRKYNNVYPVNTQ